MKLFEAIQDLKAMQGEAKEALKEAKSATSQSTLQRVFRESFNKELQALQNRLDEVSGEILGVKAEELSTQNKAEVLSLFNAQKNAMIHSALLHNTNRPAYPEESLSSFRAYHPKVY